MVSVCAHDGGLDGGEWVINYRGGCFRTKLFLHVLEIYSFLLNRNFLFHVICP